MAMVPTEKIITLINSTKFKPQIKCIMTDGIAFGGFNVIDIVEISKKTNLPVIIVMRDYPDIPKVKEILARLSMEHKIPLLEKAGEIIPVDNIHIQFSGLAKERAMEFVRLSSTRSQIPEPLRVAHLIGQGIVLGESRGKA